MPVRVQTADFDVSAELDALRAGRPSVGAVACFVGTVRDVNQGTGVSTMTLEHYPGMTERSLEAICDEARARWRLDDVLVIHRVGELAPLDRIVLVAVTSAHRGEAFAACEFVMDWLKTQAPFWKKERTSEGERWVDARESDDAAAARWGRPPGAAAGDAPGHGGADRSRPLPAPPAAPAPPTPAAPPSRPSRWRIEPPDSRTEGPPGEGMPPPVPRRGAGRAG